jgi:hypothetical protein
MAKIKIDEEMIDAVWEPIIGEELWYAVQDILKQNRNTRKKNPEEPKHTFLLSNLLYCQHCGVKLENGSGTSRNKAVHYYYRHPGKTRKPDCFYPSSLPAPKLEKIVCKEIIQKLADETAVSEIVDETATILEKHIAGHKKQCEIIEKQIQELDKENLGLLQKAHLFDEQLTRECLLPHLKNLSEKRQTLMKTKMEAEARVESMELEYLLPQDLRKLIESLVKGFDDLKPVERQRLLGMLVEKIELGKGEVKVYLAETKKDSLKPQSGSSESHLAPRDGRYSNRILLFYVKKKVDFLSA